MEVTLSFNYRSIEPKVDNLSFDLTDRIPDVSDMSYFYFDPSLLSEFRSLYRGQLTQGQYSVIPFIRNRSHGSILELLMKSEIYEWLENNNITEYRLFLDHEDRPLDKTYKITHKVFIRFKNPEDAMLYKLAIHNTNIVVE